MSFEIIDEEGGQYLSGGGSGAAHELGQAAALMFSKEKPPKEATKSSVDPERAG